MTNLALTLGIIHEGSSAKLLYSGDGCMNGGFNYECLHSHVQLHRFSKRVVRWPHYLHLD